MKKGFFIALLFAAFFFAACKNTVPKQPAGTEIAPGVTRLSNSQVCMVNNRFMNKEQTPVPVNNSVYYGCCEKCVEALKNDSTFRYALDEYTHQKVDKANAVILLKPASDEEVLYFATEENAVQYSRASKGK